VIALPAFLLALFLWVFFLGLLYPAHGVFFLIFVSGGLQNSLLAIIGTCLISTIISSAGLYTETHKQITLTEHGIMQVGISPKIQSIPWSEVRLFAISAFAASYPNNRRSQLPMICQVASEHEVIQWYWLRSKISFRLATLSVSPAEYEQQMNSVLAVIKAKTGLPLYDLRQKLS
jgi:hypothetical protein